MDELDLLKSHWKKELDLPKIAAKEIHHMMLKRSSSIVCWILICSIAELLLGIALHFTPFAEEENSPFLERLDIVYTLLLYPIVLYFIFRFYASYRQINSTLSAKDLLSKIFKVRQDLKLYIKFNLMFISIAGIISIVLFLWEKRISNQEFYLLAVFFGIFISFFLFFIFLLYRIIYGRLLRKLENNYTELLKTEDEPFE